MADRLDAESMTQVLNEYMAAMADIVEAHGGTLSYEPRPEGGSIFTVALPAVATS